MNITQLPIPRVVGAALAALPRKQFSDYNLSNDLSYAGIVLDQDGYYKLILGEKFDSLTPQQQAFILLHEYTHIAFGHPLQAKQLKLNPAGWNIVTDAWINEVHPPHYTQELNGILYSELREGMPAKPPTPECPKGIPAREPIPELPPWLLDPHSIYKILKEKYGEGFGGGNGMDSMVVEEMDEEALAKAGLETLKARAVMREALKEDSSLKDLVDELSASYRGSSNVYKSIKVAAWLENIYKQLGHLARGKRGDMVKRRGWRREGRYEGYAGYARRPSLHVMIAIDISGSTASWWDDIIAACRGIARTHEVEFVCHNDQIVYHGRAIPNEVSVGGGTQFECVTTLARKQRPDCLIWVTDGESADHPTLPDCPVYWVWLAQSSKWALRGQDYQVDYPNS